MAATTLWSIRVTNTNKVPPLATGNKQFTIQKTVNFLMSIVAGARDIAKATLLYATDQVAATGTVTISSGSGSITATINGVVSTITWATSDTVSAGLLAAKINLGGDTPNNLVLKHVTAAAVAGVVTITSRLPGFAGNAVTLAAGGTGATASGARLTGGTEVQNTFTYP